MNDTIGQKVPHAPTGQLKIVATPIGNLGDLSPRAREALASAGVILCEDTRQGAKLLSALGLSGIRLERLDAHSSPGALRGCIERLKGGETLVLVSDAGTPAVSDPGAALARLAHEEGVVITPIPGPSAALALLSVAGFDETSFAFRGFFPRKTREIEDELNLASKSQAARVFIWFESPQRIANALSEAARLFPEETAIAGKELTKIHERFFRGSLAKVSEAISREVETEGERGEWCFAICFSRPAIENPDMKPGVPEECLKALRCLLDAGISASEAAKRVSQVFDVKKNEVYASALELAGKK